MRDGRKPFWTLDAESDPFEEAQQSIERRSCPECGAATYKPCIERGKVCITVHEKRRRVPQPFIWGLYGGPNREDYYEFDTVGEVIAFLNNKNHVVYAHNGGKFDYHYLRDSINTGEAISIIAGRLAKFRIGECEFRDSMNILPVALAEFKKDTVDYSIFEPEVRDEPNNLAEIKKYLRSDCTYLYELIEAHRKENGVCLTQAGASMRAWSKQSKVKPPRQTGAQYQLYKPYYYGGRVQCFAQGIKSTDFKVIDINSAYPFAMLAAHPFSPVADRLSHLPHESEIHKCLITLRCTARGCFPFRLGNDPTKGDLFFPYDETTIRRYHVTGYEFLAALRQDAIKNIHIETVHYFEQSIKFEEFIQENWSRREQAKREGNKALNIIIKLLMNSLYGKFASDYDKYREYQICWQDDLLEKQAEGFELDTYWGNERHLISRSIPEEKHRFYNVATAASITGYVRAMLFEAVSQVSQPLYCDTDSIACVDVAKLPLGEGLGQWKVEGEFDEYAIAGKKMYSFHKAGAPRILDLDEKKNYMHYKVACKGVDLSPHEIERAAAGGEILFTPSVPTYSVKRAAPKFQSRNVKLTAKDIRVVPEVET